MIKKTETKDLLKDLSTIMESHTKHYKSDFDLDVKTLTSAAQKAGDAEPKDRIFLWMVRTSGTWCLSERNVFMKGTWEHATWTYYMDQEPGKILAYRVEVGGMENGKVIGSICKLDYPRHSQYVDRVAIPVGQNRLFFEKGERVLPAAQRLPIRDDEGLGNLVSFEPIPEDPGKLKALLGTASDSSNWDAPKPKKKQ